MMRALVLGLGVSGLAATDLLLEQGYEVIGVDAKVEAVRDHPLEKKGAVFVPDSQEIDMGSIQLCVVSPGISPRHPLYVAAQLCKVPLLGEAELGLRRLSRYKALAITGTNGKTTVTLLVEHVLCASGILAKAVGNIGEPLSCYQPREKEVLVVELSSYQLETWRSPLFDAGVILNITPDHLDRYATMHDYARAKYRLQGAIKPGGALYVDRASVQAFPDIFGDPHLYQILDSQPPFALPGGMQGHEVENAMAAWVLVQELGVTQEQFISAMQSFKKPPHRIEYVATIDGVDFYDDSKGTNVDAVIRAVAAMKGRIVLIAGGLDKGASYKPWIPHFQNRVHRVIAIGQAAPKIIRELSEAIVVERAEDLGNAVERASLCAQRGDVVLLSPGCSSYDMFRDYVHRGEEFKRHVRQLQNSSAREKR